MRQDTDDGVPIRNRTKNQLNPLVLPLAIGAAVVFLVAAIGGLILLNSGGSPVVALGYQPESKTDGKNWGVKQFADHLKAKGAILDFEVSDGPFGGQVAKLRFGPGRIYTVEKYKSDLAMDDDLTGKFDLKNRGATEEAFVTWGQFAINTGWLSSGSEVFKLADHLEGAKYRSYFDDLPLTDAKKLAASGKLNRPKSGR